MNSVIIGAGAIGTALGSILKENKNNTVDFWDAIPGKVKRQASLARIIPASDAVFFCLPSFALRDAVEMIRPFLKKKTIIVCVSKGVEAGTNLTMDQLLNKILPRRQPFVLLFGPMLASELTSGICGHAVCAGMGKATSIINELFSNTRLMITQSTDVHGVALCGALKNVYAIGLGIIAALKSGDNMRGAYVVSARYEMQQIVKLLGGRAETVDGFSGLGDLVATGLNETSRNRQIGCTLVMSPGRCQGSEGARSATAISELLGKKRSKFTLFSAIYRVLVNAASPAEVTLAVCSWR